MPTNYSACIRIHMQVLNISWDKVFVVNVQPKILGYTVNDSYKQLPLDIKK